MKKVSILGCGWLGFPLAEILLKDGIEVNGSTTNEAKLEKLKTSGINPFLINISSTKIEFSSEDFFICDYIVLNFPPGRSEERAVEFTSQMKLLSNELKRVNPNVKIIFISSTSVYPDNSGFTREDCNLLPDKDSGKALLFAEQLLLQNFKEVTILRMAGLIGYDRVPAKFLSGKKNLKSGSAPVNLVHRDDCIRIILKIILTDTFGKIYNVCSDKHPLRKEYYTKAAQLAKISIPEFDFDELDSNAKIIDNSLLKEELNFRYLYPDPELIL